MGPPYLETYRLLARHNLTVRQKNSEQALTFDVVDRDFIPWFDKMAEHGDGSPRPVTESQS